MFKFLILVLLANAVSALGVTGRASIPKGCSAKGFSICHLNGTEAREFVAVDRSHWKTLRFGEVRLTLPKLGDEIYCTDDDVQEITALQERLFDRGYERAEQSMARYITESLQHSSGVARLSDATCLLAPEKTPCDDILNSKVYVPRETGQTLRKLCPHRLYYLCSLASQTLPHLDEVELRGGILSCLGAWKLLGDTVEQEVLRHASLLLFAAHQRGQDVRRASALVFTQALSPLQNWKEIRSFLKNKSTVLDLIMAGHTIRVINNMQAGERKTFASLAHNYGVLLGQKGEQQAIELLSLSLLLQPLRPTTLHALATALQKSNPVRALQFFERALELKPNECGFVASITVLLFESGSFERAISSAAPYVACTVRATSVHLNMNSEVVSDLSSYFRRMIGKTDCLSLCDWNSFTLDVRQKLVVSYASILETVGLMKPSFQLHSFMAAVRMHLNVSSLERPSSNVRNAALSLEMSVMIESCYRPPVVLHSTEESQRDDGKELHERTFFAIWRAAIVKRVHEFTQARELRRMTDIHAISQSTETLQTGYTKLLKRYIGVNTTVLVPPTESSPSMLVLALATESRSHQHRPVLRALSRYRQQASRYYLSSISYLNSLNGFYVLQDSNIADKARLHTSLSAFERFYKSLSQNKAKTIQYNSESITGYIPGFTLPEGDLGDLSDIDNNEKMFIIKPTRAARGWGLRLFPFSRLPLSTDGGRIGSLERGRYVAQEYICDPLLADGRKFHLRWYVVVSSLLPLRAYSYRESLMLVCKTNYSGCSVDIVDTEGSFTSGDVKSSHLCNTAISGRNVIDKGAKTRVPGKRGGILVDFSGDQASLVRLFGIGKNNTSAFSDDLSRTLQGRAHAVAAAPVLTSDFSAAVVAHRFSERHARSATEDIRLPIPKVLGLDIQYRQNEKAHLLEVNESPSFQCESTMECELKAAVVQAALESLYSTPSRVALLSESRRLETALSKYRFLYLLRQRFVEDRALTSDFYNVIKHGDLCAGSNEEETNALAFYLEENSQIVDAVSRASLEEKRAQELGLTPLTSFSLDQTLRLRSPETQSGMKDRILMLAWASARLPPVLAWRQVFVFTSLVVQRCVL